MPVAKFERNAIGLYRSVSSALGDPQPNPHLSLGGYRSSTRLMAPGMKIRRGIPGLLVTQWSGANESGTGLLQARTADSVVYRPPGGVFGVAVDLPVGEDTMVRGGAELAKWVIVRRLDIRPLLGTTELIFAPQFNNAVGMSNVSSIQAIIGSEKLRLVVWRNESEQVIEQLRAWVRPIGTVQVQDLGQLGGSGTGTIQTSGSFADWQPQGFARIVKSSGSLKEIVYYSSRTDDTLTISDVNHRGLLGGPAAAAGLDDDLLYNVPGLRMAEEGPGLGELFTQAASESDAAVIAAMTWSSEITPQAGLTLGTGVGNTLGPGDHWGLWLRLTMPPNVVATPEMLVQFGYGWEY